MMSTQSAEVPFDPTLAISFDLGRGHVRQDDDEASVFVPAAAVLELCIAASLEARSDFAQAIGAAIGRRLRRRFAQADATGSNHDRALLAATFERVMEHLAGELALLGCGALAAERWGDALVLVVDDSPLRMEAVRERAATAGVIRAGALLAPLLGAALSEATGFAVAAVELPPQGGAAVKLLVVSAAAAPVVRERLDGGELWGELLAKLHTRALGHAAGAFADVGAGHAEGEVRP